MPCRILANKRADRAYEGASGRASKNTGGNSYGKGEETGWYTLQIGSYTNTKNAYDVYSKIKEAGLKPSIEIVGQGLVRISVKYVQSYKLESVMKTLSEIGITEPLIKGEANPYN